MYKLAIIGPESTGKSVLAEELAKHYNGDWIPEYARTYVESLKGTYQFEDLDHIAQKQIEQKKAYENKHNHGFVFFDTDLIITKVWFEHCYGIIPAFVEESLATGFFDYYLLCAPDIPWVADGVRENGNDREYFFNWYQSEIIKLNKPYTVIKGLGKERTNSAIRKINEFFKISKS